MKIMIAGIILFLAAVDARAEKAEPLTALASMPIREITVFKNGYAFVAHEGVLPTDPEGNVVLDYLPTPVLGTFWPYSAETSAKLAAVVAGQRRVRIPRTALTLRELIEANLGASVLVTEIPAGKENVPLTYPADIVGVPERSGEELEATSPPGTAEQLPQKGEIVILKTVEGAKAIPLSRILDLTFKNDRATKLESEEFRNLLTLKIDWPGGKTRKEASVGLLYLQKGIRWIPSYKIDINGQGQAKTRLNATIINDLADVKDVAAHLVVGVPSFAFKDQIDPMALNQTLAELSRHFPREEDAKRMLSNAIMSQVVDQVGSTESDIGMGVAGPEVTGAMKTEDLFIFDLARVSLKKGQRMVLPAAEFTLPYRDVYALEIPFAPPAEIWNNFNGQQQDEIARLSRAPKVMHKIRLNNTSPYPLTTAPALILDRGKVLSQGMMTYTPAGAEADVELTAAVDIQVKKSETETKRTPNAVRWQGDEYGRIDLAGKITLTNFAATAREVEVTRFVLGNVGEAGQGGKAEMVNIFEDHGYAPGGVYPSWWPWYSWPGWWSHFNGVGRIAWKVALEPGKPVDLDYDWHYSWR
ncbi:MAG: hypothetical protein NTV79_06415 [Candidatus Aureabacteria bacterium]|nr:hypothetical protein [Candidatus Auribacterota bacterium]